MDRGWPNAGHGGDGDWVCAGRVRVCDHEARPPLSRARVLDRRCWERVSLGDIRSCASDSRKSSLMSLLVSIRSRTSLYMAQRYNRTAGLDCSHSSPIRGAAPSDRLAGSDLIRKPPSANRIPIVHPLLLPAEWRTLGRSLFDSHSGRPHDRRSRRRSMPPRPRGLPSPALSPSHRSMQTYVAAHRHHPCCLCLRAMHTSGSRSNVLQCISATTVLHTLSYGVSPTLTCTMFYLISTGTLSMVLRQSAADLFPLSLSMASKPLPRHAASSQVLLQVHMQALSRIASLLMPLRVRTLIWRICLRSLL